MIKNFVIGLMLCAAVPATDAVASGGYAAFSSQQVVRQRIVQRQPLLGRFRQRLQLQQVQQVYAAPVVQAQVVQRVRVKQFVQPVYAAPIVQQQVYAAPVVVQPYVAVPQLQIQSECLTGACPLQQQLQQYTPALPQCQ